MLYGYRRESNHLDFTALLSLRPSSSKPWVTTVQKLSWISHVVSVVRGQVRIWVPFGKWCISWHFPSSTMHRLERWHSPFYEWIQLQQHPRNSTLSRPGWCQAFDGSVSPCIAWNAHSLIWDRFVDGAACVSYGGLRVFCTKCTAHPSRYCSSPLTFLPPGQEDTGRHHANTAGHADRGGLWRVRCIPPQPIHRVGQIRRFRDLHEQIQHRKAESQSAGDRGVLFHRESSFGRWGVAKIKHRPAQGKERLPF